MLTLRWLHQQVPISKAFKHQLYLKVVILIHSYCLQSLHYYLISANGTIQTQTVPSQVRGGAAPNGQQQQIRLAAAAGGQPQQFVTLNGGQQVAVQMQPQVMQFPQSTQQTMVPVQIPVSQNGQTVYQTVQMPMAAPAIQTAIVPQMIQTSAGQQIVMQQVQIAQPQIAQPQFAQILMPNGQLQQVQVIQQPQQMFTSIAGFPAAAAAIQQHQQIPVQATAVISSSTTTASASTILSSPISSTSSTTSITSPTTTTKMEPVIVKTESLTAEDQKSPNNMITLNGQQVVVQQPMTFNNAAPAIQSSQQIVSVRTANGQIVQVPAATAGAAQVQQPPQTSTVHIPGIGAVQIMNAVPLGATNAGTTFTTPNGTAQIVNAAPQFANTQSQQALQQDPNDPTKWHVVQVATAAGIPSGLTQVSAAPAASVVVSQSSNQMAGVVATPQMANTQTTAQIVTANGTVIGSATIPANATTIATVAEGSVKFEGATANNDSANGQQTKARLRRVACTCPNCKDGDRSRK